MGVQVQVCVRVLTFRMTSLFGLLLGHIGTIIRNISSVARSLWRASFLGISLVRRPASSKRPYEGGVILLIDKILKELTPAYGRRVRPYIQVSYALPAESKPANSQCEAQGQKSKSRGPTVSMWCNTRNSRRSYPSKEHVSLQLDLHPCRQDNSDNTTSTILSQGEA